MSCAACANHVEKAVGKLDGVEAVGVNLMLGSMSVTYNEKAVTDDAIMAAVTAAGYGARRGSDTERGKAKSQQDRALLAMRRRLIWSVVLLVPLFYLAMGHMLSLPVPLFSVVPLCTSVLMAGTSLEDVSYVIITFTLPAPLIEESTASSLPSSSVSACFCSCSVSFGGSVPFPPPGISTNSSTPNAISEPYTISSSFLFFFILPTRREKAFPISNSEATVYPPQKHKKRP